MLHSEQVYQRYIRLLSWQLLIELNASEMPVRITAISKLYGFQNIVDYNETRWDNAKIISAGVLDRFGLNYSGTAREELSVKILAPLCVLRECNIQYPEDIVKLADIPYIEATKRFNRLMSLRAVPNIEQEQVILRQFKRFIQSQRGKETTNL